MHNRIQVQLACTCWDELPVQDHTAYRGLPCVSHGWQYIVKRNLHEYRVKCHRCTFSRWTGQSKELAQRYAARHKARQPEHHVSVILDLVTPDGHGNISLPRRDGRGLNMRPQRRVTWSPKIPPQQVPDDVDNPPPF